MADNPKPPMHGRDHRVGGADPIPGLGLDTTDGVVDVDPTLQLFIGTGLVLTNPVTGEARIDAETIVYVPPIATEYLSGVVGPVASTAAANYSWSHSSGAALVDYADPFNPKIIVAGIYGFSGHVDVSEVITAGYLVASSFGVFVGEDPASLGEVVGGVIDGYKSIPVAVGPVYCPANTVFGGGLTNFDIVNHSAGVPSFLVQRIT